MSLGATWSDFHQSRSDFTLKEGALSGTIYQVRSTELLHDRGTCTLMRSEVDDYI
jgi:hypothetical protein